MKNNTDPIRICVTRSQKQAYSETFIRDQITVLSEFAEVYSIHSSRYPERQEDNTLLSPRPFWLLHKVLKPLLGRNNYFSNFGVERYLRNNRIEVVISNFGISAAHMVPVCKKLNIPLIPVFLGHDATDVKLLHAYRKAYKTLFAYSTAMISFSAALKEKLVAQGADPDKIKVVPNGVNTAKFSPNPKVPDELRILAVGRFTEKKGPQHTIRAFHRVLQKFPNATLTMVGGKSELFMKCEALVAELGIAHAVQFTGALQHQQVAELMRDSLVFVQHSVTASNGDMEGTPVGIMEASASGLPVVSTRHGGIMEAVIHGTTGYLVAERDEAGMAEYMMRLCEDPARAKAMGLEGRRHMQENYEQREQIRKQYELACQAAGRPLK